MLTYLILYRANNTLKQDYPSYDVDLINFNDSLTKYFVDSSVYAVVPIEVVRCNDRYEDVLNHLYKNGFKPMSPNGFDANPLDLAKCIYEYVTLPLCKYKERNKIRTKRLGEIGKNSDEYTKRMYGFCDDEEKEAK